MKKRVHGVAALALSLAAITVMAAPGLAETTTVDQDRTDNSVSFEYDSSSGTIESATSSERASRNDIVYFKVSVLETEDSGSGLLGKLTLRLDGDRHTVYDGWFELDIATGSGDTAYHRSMPVSVHLRPQPGQRRATLRFRFDLPSGDYEAGGSFDSSE